jgi:hypothetical protein
MARMFLAHTWCQKNTHSLPPFSALVNGQKQKHELTIYNRSGGEGSLEQQNLQASIRAANLNIIPMISPKQMGFFGVLVLVSFFLKNYHTARCQWRTPIILATEAEIRRITA